MSTPAPTTTNAGATATPAATPPVTPTPLYDNTPAPAAEAKPNETPSATPAPAAAAPAEPNKTDTATPSETPAPPAKVELKLPDGSLLDAARVEQISSLAKEKNLTQDQAQLILERESDAVKTFNEAQQNALKERRETWRTQATADKEIGGDALPKNVELAHRALKHFGGDALMQELETTGYGNHPEVVRVFARIGKAMGEDKFVAGGSAVTAKKSMAETFYPTTTKT